MNKYDFKYNNNYCVHLIYGGHSKNNAHIDNTD